LSQGVPASFSKAIIEGIGVVLLPATSRSSGTFHGREATAFAVGRDRGRASAVGPVVGGFLTTNFSWRWAFGINVIVAPLTLVGVPVHEAGRNYERRQDRCTGCGDDRRRHVPARVRAQRKRDLRVVGTVEGLHDRRPCRVADGRAISFIPIMFVVSVVVLVSFYAERWKERRQRIPVRVQPPRPTGTDC
jgi:MFS family permease